MSARVVGYSPSAVAVLVVVLARREDGAGVWWGANGWRGNSAERRTYYWEQAEGKGSSDE